MNRLGRGLISTIYPYSLLKERYMDENLLKVGKYDNKFNEILGIEIAEVEIYRSKGLPAHMLKSKHQNCVYYV